MKEKTEYIKNINFIQPLSQILDFIVVVSAALLAYKLRDFPVIVDPQIYAIAATIGALYTIVIFRIMDIYPNKQYYEKQTPIKRIFLAWSIVFVLLALTAYLTKTGEYFSRIWFVMWGGYTLALLTVIKFIFLRVLHSNLFLKWSQKKIVLIGSYSHSCKVKKQITQSGHSELNLLGHINSDNDPHQQADGKLKVFGQLEDINSILEKNDVDEIWITLPLSSQDIIRNILYMLRHNTVNIRMVPDIFELRLLNQSITDIAGIPLINLCESPMSGLNKVAKTLEDYLLSLIILTLFSSLFIIIPIIIKLTSKGPVFYLQKRIGWNGKEFNILKFRTMPTDIEKGSGPVWAKEGDNRSTRFGSFLRRSSLDEIPQFINVLKGDMSIVGPRPERPEFVNEFKEEIPGYMKKHMVKAGITGWAQINGWRGDTDLKTRIEHDLYYIENWSVLFDIKIISLTVVKGFTNINAY